MPLPVVVAVTDFKEEPGVRLATSGHAEEAKVVQFDAIYNTMTTQSENFEIPYKIVESVINGYNGTTITHGQVILILIIH